MDRQGWGNPQPFSSKSKFHYFRDGRSLCGKWGDLFGLMELDDKNHNHSENCAQCKKRKLAEIEKESAQTTDH
jgi:hypothetical protein